MTFDLSHLYRSETIDVLTIDDKVVFSVTVRQITHGEQTDAKALVMSEVEVPIDGSKAHRRRKLRDELKKAMQNGVSAKISIYEEIAAIESWTLKDASGQDVPVCVEAWRALPALFATQITEAIEMVNPELDDEFQD